ncbi:MAG: hypothetical protein OXT73_08275 [Bacteroidota bacterium]|nr:hypothetical protein [Bacteroidota bacterium]
MMTRRTNWMRIGILLLMLTGGALSAAAQGAGSFARLGFGARGIGMGNAQAADVFRSTSPWYNPALAPLAPGQSIEGSVSALSFDRSLQFLQLGAPLQQRAGLAAGLVHASVSNIDGRDNSGFHTGNLSVDEFAGFLAFGLRFSKKVSAGINLQFFQSDLYQGLKAARTIGVDMGLAIRPKDDWAAALVLDDLLARYTWDGSSVGGSGAEVTDNFPRRIRLGVAHTRFDDRWLFSAELESRSHLVTQVSLDPGILGDGPARTRDETDLTLREIRLRAGVEMLPLDGFAVRAGLEQLGEDTLGSFRPSAGFTAEQPIGELRIRVDYAFGWEAQAGGRMHFVTLRFFL